MRCTCGIHEVYFKSVGVHATQVDTITHTEDITELLLEKIETIHFMLPLKVIMVAIEHMKHPRGVGKVCVHLFLSLPQPMPSLSLVVTAID